MEASGPSLLVFVALTAPGEAESVRTVMDVGVFLYPVAWSIFLLIFLIAVFFPPSDFLPFNLAAWFVSGFALFKVTQGVAGERFKRIRIRNRVVHGVARNGFGMTVDRWDEKLEAYRVTPTRILLRSRIVVMVVSHEDGPIEAMGAAELRLEHITQPERTVVLILHRRLPIASPVPLDAEAAEYAAHLGLPVGELATATEIFYPSTSGRN